MMSVFSLASNRIDHLEPSHSTMSFTLATKSVLSAFFQASGPSVLLVLPTSPKSKNLVPAFFWTVGLNVVGSII